jgi:hypothetical protein
VTKDRETLALAPGNERRLSRIDGQTLEQHLARLRDSYAAR